MNEELRKYAIELARPCFCETQLSRFLIRIKDCITKEQVYSIFLEIRTGTGRR